jgi:hypothetical protein
MREAFDVGFLHDKTMMQHMLLDEFSRRLANKLSNGQGTTLERSRAM